VTDLRNYAVVTGPYWTFTLSDGALRMLVLLHFYTLGFTPFQLAFLFLLYEFFGVVTNLMGGWIASRIGIKVTLCGGLALQVFALLMLAGLDERWALWLSIAYVVAAQGLSGIAKDLTKMSSKSAIKLVIPDDAHGTLFKWVALLTGSKNTLKGVGFFLGGLLLGTLGFELALYSMATVLAVVLLMAAFLLPGKLGQAKEKEKLSRLFSKTPEINLLSAARFFLFGARDVWFVVGVPVFLYGTLHWTFTEVGSFLAVWVIGYGVVQAVVPGFVARSADGRTSETRAARQWAFVLGLIPIAIVIAMTLDERLALSWLTPGWVIIVGLGAFGVAFAINSSLHSYLILAFTDTDKVALNVGFYYMANAGGRLVGTFLSGVMYQAAGLAGCLLTASALIGASWLITLALPVGRRDVDAAVPWS
tara:strand:- start:360 stop:1616 length:1257 start_codon:yes stop_codon:yes gene_type:complete